MYFLDLYHEHAAHSGTGAFSVRNAVQERLRAILLTVGTTVMGLVPLSLLGGDMWRPMANVLIFGLTFCSLFTLLLCPVLYSLFFGIRDQGRGDTAEKPQIS